MTGRMSSSGFIRPAPEYPEVAYCKHCGESDVRPEDGAHAWHTCGQHLLAQRNAAYEALERIRAALQGVCATEEGGFTDDPYVDGIKALRAEIAQLKMRLPVDREADDKWCEVRGAPFRRITKRVL